MRSTLTAFIVLTIIASGNALITAGTSYAQGTSSKSGAPNQTTAPVGQRQPRAADVPGGRTSPNSSSSNPAPDSSNPATDDLGPDMLDPGGRMNRALNSICRGC